MKSKTLARIAAAFLLAGMIFACKELGGGMDDFSNLITPAPPGTGPLTFKGVTQNGGDGYRTTALTLSFSASISGLAASNITLTPLDEGNPNPNIKTGTLEGKGPAYTLYVSGIEGDGDVEVSVDNIGRAISGNPKKVTVYASGSDPGEVVFSSLAANGAGETKSLTLTFGSPVDGLLAGNIELDGGVTGAEAGSLTKDGDGTSYTLDVSGINVSGDVSVSVTKAGYTFKPASITATVLAAESGSSETTGGASGEHPDPVAFTGVSANGKADGDPTTVLYLNFDASISGLGADNIELTPVGEQNTSIQKGALGGDGPTYWLYVNGVAVEGYVKVRVSKSGCAVTGNPQTAAVHAGAYVNSGGSGSSSDSGSGSGGGSGSSSDSGSGSGGGSGSSSDSGSGSGGGSGSSSDSGSGSGGGGSGSSSDSGSGSGGGGSGGSTPEKVVFSELTANGSAYVAETTELTLTFDRAIEGGLVLDNITLNGGGAGAAAYSLSGSGVSYTLYVTGITAEGDVSVIVNKQGFTFEPPVKTVTVHRQGTPVTMTAEQTGGSDSPGASATTTYLKLTFNTDIDGLNKNEITLTSLVPGNNSISAGDPQWGGTWYTVPVSGIDKSGQINVSVNKSGYSIRAKTVYVYYADKVAFTGVEVDGQAETTPTTKLTLTFDKDIAGLNEYDITLSNSGLQKGVLSKVPETTGHYALPVTVTTAETLTVTVAGKSGYIISPVFDQTLVHTGNVTLSKVEANGGTNATTTQLTLTFDKAIAGLTAGDITLSGDAAAGVTKTTLSASEGNTKWKLGLDNVTRSGNISVSVSKTGYVISSSPKSAAVSYIVPVTLYSVTPDGGTNATTTQLTLAFDKDITGLTAGDITLSSYNNNKGTLGKTGTGTYILPVSGITSTGSVTVNSVSKSGYSITGAPREVPVFVASGAAPGTSASPGTPEYLDYVKTYFMGTGGTTKIIDNTDGTYDEVHIFTSTDTGQYLTFMRKPRTGTVEVLVVGGGGGSGLGASGPNRWGRSGGAGGYIYLNNFDVTVSPYFVVTVGAGGAYSAGTGTYSQIASPNGIYYIKANGGTGGSYIGGAGVGGSCGSVEVALKSGSSTIPGYQGFAGGENSGGAGAGGNGQGDTGELGVESSISGEAKAYAAGGYYGASANTGNGAKGGYAGSYGSAGSSGIVIVRWRWDP